MCCGRRVFLFRSRWERSWAGSISGRPFLETGPSRWGRSVTRSCWVAAATSSTRSRLPWLTWRSPEAPTSTMVGRSTSATSEPRVFHLSWSFFVLTLLGLDQLDYSIWKSDGYQLRPLLQWLGGDNYNGWCPRYNERTRTVQAQTWPSAWPSYINGWWHQSYRFGGCTI